MCIYTYIAFNESCDKEEKIKKLIPVVHFTDKVRQTTKLSVTCNSLKYKIKLREKNDESPEFANMY